MQRVHMRGRDRACDRACVPAHAGTQGCALASVTMSRCVRAYERVSVWVRACVRVYVCDVCTCKRVCVCVCMIVAGHVYHVRVYVCDVCARVCERMCVCVRACARHVCVILQASLIGIYV